VSISNGTAPKDVRPRVRILAFNLFRRHAIVEESQR
jgi:hypothetical protein